MDQMPHIENSHQPWWYSLQSLDLQSWEDLRYKLFNQVHSCPVPQHGISWDVFMDEDRLQLLKHRQMMFFQLTLIAMTQGEKPWETEQRKTWEVTVLFPEHTDLMDEINEK